VTRASQAINKTYKTVDTRSLAITTVMTSFGHNIPSTHLQHHQLRPEYLQPKEHHLYGCGGLPHSYRWNYGRFGFINNIYIFINLLHIKIYIFSVSRILTFAALDSGHELYIGEPIKVSNYDTILQTLVPLDYAIKLYTLWHTSHYLLLKLVRYFGYY
jgi:hypothetical protein